MEGRLGEDRANIIRQAIRTDGFSVGSQEWLDSHYVSRDEFETFLMYAVEMAKNLDWRESNLEVGSAEVEMQFVSHTGKVGDTDEKWTVRIPNEYTRDVLMVAGSTDRVIAHIFPNQLTMDLDGKQVDMSSFTGEIYV